MSGLVERIRNARGKINAFAPFFLVAYFLLLVFPYCTGRIPTLYSLICVNVIGRVIFRLIPTGFLFAYGSLAWIANRSKMRWEWLFPMVALWAAYILAWIFTPDTYVYVSMSWNRSLTYSSTTVGWLDAAIAFGTLVAESLILLFWISIFPDIIRNRKAVLVPLLVVAAFAWLSVILSLALEWKLYVDLIKGGDHKGLHSIFFQKNEYGAFMFMGTFASAFLAYFTKSKLKWAYLLSSLGLTAVTMFVRCYTALMSETVVVVALLLATVAQIRRKSKRVAYAFLSVFVLAVSAVLVCTFIPAVRDNQPIFRVFYSSLMSIEKEIETRTIIWRHLSDVADGYHIFLGITDGVSDAKLGSLQIVNDEAVVSIFHNSYIAYLAIHGLAGLLVYIALIFRAAKSCFSYKKIRLAGSLFLLCMLIGYLLQGVAETYVLFIKMSVLTLPLTLVFFVFLPTMDREGFYEI